MASQCLYSISQCLTRHQYMSLMSLSKEPLTSVQIGWQYFRHYHIKRCTLLIEREVLETSIFRPFLGDTSMFETPFSRFSETDQKHSGNDYIPSWKFLIPHSFFKKNCFFFSLSFFWTFSKRYRRIHWNGANNNSSFKWRRRGYQGYETHIMLLLIKDKSVTKSKC